MEKHKTCSFFGHREVEITEELEQRIKEVVEELIINHNVSIFLFGSNSNFDYLCHLVVTKLKEKFSYLDFNDFLKNFNLEVEEFLYN